MRDDTESSGGNMIKGKSREETLDMLRREMAKEQPFSFGTDIKKIIRKILKCSQLTADQYLHDLKDFGYVEIKDGKAVIK